VIWFSESPLHFATCRVGACLEGCYLARFFTPLESSFQCSLAVANYYLCVCHPSFQTEGSLEVANYYDDLLVTVSNCQQLTVRGSLAVAY
jgi:hypothetical protein